MIELDIFLGIQSKNDFYNADTISHDYNSFLLTIHNCINKAVPSKSVYMGGGDPEFVTPLIKSLLNKQYNLWNRAN